MENVQQKPQKPKLALSEENRVSHDESDVREFVNQQARANVERGFKEGDKWTGL